MPEVALYEAQYRSLRALSIALEERDEHTGHHCDRVQLCAAMLGEAAGVGRLDMAILRTCAIFHDVGKIGIPDAILLKPTPFDAAEWEIMKSHAARGERILLGSDLPNAGKVAAAIRHHHEHFAGGGYPDGLAGDDIPLLARIISIADAYDAMRMPRPYRAPMDHATVMSIMETEQGKKFEPGLFRAFREVVTRLPASLI